MTRFAPLLLLAMLAAVPLALVGCGPSKTPKPRTVIPVVRDVPPLLRGTIGAEASIAGIEPTLVSGLGLVVGLNGTGGGPLPDRIAATMEREMGLMGIGRAGDFDGTAIANKSPREVLRDANVAVVIVQASIAPGSPEGATFDVSVKAVNATSLEGGRLWTTDLRLGQAATFGAVQTKRIAFARGPIFINPFAEPGQTADGITRTVGRVLDGGTVVSPFELAIITDNPSFSRARSIVSAINSRFPEGPGDDGPIARGVSGGNMETGAGGRIALSIPASYRNNAADFLNIIRFLPIDNSFPEETARRIIEGLKNEPGLTEPLSWALVAVGDKGLPFARELYDYAEREPRLAALRAGARLNDPQAANHLEQIARSGDLADRAEAIELLASIDAGPTVDQALKSLLNADELVIRVEAYEGLAARAERLQFGRMVLREQAKARATGEARPLSQIEVLSRASLSGGVQGITRTLVPGKFLLDVVPVGDPLIYVTQQGQPRVVLFGDGLTLRPPLLVSAWSDRLLMASDNPGDPLRLLYRDERGGQSIRQEVSGDLAAIVRFMATTPTPEDPRPGLGLSYAETVGALYALNAAGATTGAFATERDRLLAGIAAASRSNVNRDRPETPEQARELLLIEAQPAGVPGKPAQAAPPKIVPIPVPEKKKRSR